MDVILETDSDVVKEVRAVQRFIDRHLPGATFIRFPHFSKCDYLILRDEQPVYFVEMKLRKEDFRTLKSKYFTGLFLRKDKIETLLFLEDMLKVPSMVVFADQDGEGDFRFCYPKHLDMQHVKYYIPPPRRNGRDAQGDDAPVADMDWDFDIVKELL